MLEELLVILSTAEPSGSLLVHLAPRSNSIKRKDNGLGGLEQVDDGIDIIEDFNPYFLEFLGHKLRLEDDRIVLHRSNPYPDTLVDDAVHIEVKIVDLR